MHIILDKAKNDPFFGFGFLFLGFSKKKCFCFFQMKISVPFIWGIIYFYTTDGFPRTLEKTWSELICTRLYFFCCSTKHPDFVCHRVVIVKNFQVYCHKYKLWFGAISYILDSFCLNPNWIVAFGWCFFLRNEVFLFWISFKQRSLYMKTETSS